MQIRNPKEARASDVTVYFCSFDVTFLLGRDCMGLPLRGRKRRLRDAIRFEDPLRFTSHRTADAQLRHPRFIGLRRDKDPRDAVREDRRRTP